MHTKKYPQVMYILSVVIDVCRAPSRVKLEVHVHIPKCLGVINPANKLFLPWQICLPTLPRILGLKHCTNQWQSRESWFQGARLLLQPHPLPRKTYPNPLAEPLVCVLQLSVHPPGTDQKGLQE